MITKSGMVIYLRTISRHLHLLLRHFATHTAQLDQCRLSAMAIIRVSYISKGLTKVSQETILELANKKATHVTFHGNQICSLEIKAVIDLSLVDLDLSSNSLHSGYTFTNFGVEKNLCLCCCHSLLKLNLQANAFTSKSFDAFVTGLPILPRLTLLDISHNNISKLPSDFNEKFPSLLSLSAFSNQIKSLSSLLQLLHHYRGQLERLILHQKGSSNPVYSAALYREKLIFVLGNGLIQLDSRTISEDERKQVRARLSIYSTSCSNAEKDVASHEPADQEVKKQDYHIPAYTNDENNANSADIEHRVEYLSNLIEKQAHITSGLLEVTQHQSDGKIEMSTADNNNEPDDNSWDDALEVQVDNAATTSTLRKASACTLVQLTLLKERHKRSLLRMTFCHWMLAAKFSRQMVKFKKSEVKWRQRANDVVAKAAKEEQRKSISALKEVEERNSLLEERVSHLNERIKELDADIQFEQSKSTTFVQNSASETDRLKKDLQQARSIMKRMKEERSVAAVDIETIRSELHHTQQELQKEKDDKARLELMYKELSKVTQDARESSMAHSVELHDLKLEVATKDATIKQLKAAFEQAASRAASDRSKCEHALAGERRKGDMVKAYGKKFRSLEEEKQKLASLRDELEAATAEKQSQIASMQQVANEHVSKNANLRAIIEEKECKMNSLERRLKYISDERDDFHHQLTECKSAMTQLQLQLDRANNEVRDSKRSSAEVHQFETMKLQQTLDALRQSSQLREQEMSTTLKLLRRECQEKTGKQAKLIKSLGHKLKGYEARESDLERSHRSELQQLQHCREQELKTLKETLTNESESIICVFIISTYAAPNSYNHKLIIICA